MITLAGLTDLQAKVKAWESMRGQLTTLKNFMERAQGIGKPVKVQLMVGVDEPGFRVGGSSTPKVVFENGTALLSLVLSRMEDEIGARRAELEHLGIEFKPREEVESDEES